jgi:hypothetical protein
LLNDFKLEVDIILDFSAHRNAPNKCLTFWGHIILALGGFDF